MIQGLKRKVERFREAPHMREVLEGMVVAFVLKVAGAGLSFGFNVAIARLLGAEGTGIYFLALSVTVIGSVIGRVGLDNALLRFIATHATKQEWGKVRGIHALAFRIAIISSGSISLIVFLLAPWMATALFNKPELVEPLRWMGLSILPFALLNLQAESLKGLKKVRDALTLQSIGLPLIALLTIYPLTQISGVTGVTYAYLLAATIMSLLGAWLWRKSMAVHEDLSDSYLFKDLWVSCRPLFLTSLMNRAVIPWMPLFLLGMWVSSEDVGIYGAVARVAALVSFILIIANNVLAPKFAELHSKGDLEGLTQVAQKSALLTMIVGAPIFILFFIYGEWVMALFGDEFRKGSVILAVLIIGQMVNAFTGSVGFVLMMGGYEQETWRSLLFSVLVLLIFCVLLIPQWGVMGCAISVVLADVVKNTSLVIYCKKRIGIMPVPFFSFGSSAK